MQEPLPIKEVEGQKWDKVLMAVDLGNGFCNYALFKGVWYSVNTDGDRIQDVRWAATTRERDQIIAVLQSRLKRNL